MSAAHRSLARLPLAIFENLAISSNCYKEENENNNDDDDDIDVIFTTAEAAVAAKTAAVDDYYLSFRDDPATLRNAICQKLKAIPPSKQMPHRRKSIRSAAAANAAKYAATNMAHSSGNNDANTNTNTLMDSIQTVGPLLFLSLPALVRALDPILTYGECSELIRRICLHCAPKPKSAMVLLQTTRDLGHSITATSLYTQQQQQSSTSSSQEEMTTPTTAPMRYIPTGLSSLDRQLRGGFRVGTVTEIVGQTAVAKSQMAMQLAIMAGIHFGQGSVYIDTERKLSLQRLEEMAMCASRQHQQRQHDQQWLASQQSMSPHAFVRQGIDDDEEKAFRHCRDFLGNVSVHTPSNMDELRTTLASAEDDIYLRNEKAEEARQQPPQQQQHYHNVTAETVSSFPVRLLILDSIAAPAQREFGSGSAAQRAAAVMQCAQTLKRLADELQLAVVVVNQVGSASSTSSSTLVSTLTSSNNAAQQQQPSQQQHGRAALGTAWHHCVSTRIHLAASPPPLQSAEGANDMSAIGLRLPASNYTHQEQIARIPRTASIVKSNVTGPGAPISFEVTTQGLVEMILPLGSSQYF